MQLLVTYASYHFNPIVTYVYINKAANVSKVLTFMEMCNLLWVLNI